MTFDVESAVNINAITQTTDGGFVLAGQVGSSGATLIKLRPNGTTSWKKSLTVSGVGFDYLFRGGSYPDGGVIAIGRRLMEEFDSSPRLFIATLTAAGDIVWEKSFGTLLDNFFGPAFVIHSTSTSDGGLIIAFSIPGSGMEAMKITNPEMLCGKNYMVLGLLAFNQLEQPLTVELSCEHNFQEIECAHAKNRWNNQLESKIFGSSSW